MSLPAIETLEIRKEYPMATSSHFENDESRDQFLATPRLAVLLTNRQEGTPMGVPIWFDWDGEVVRMFADASTPKVRRLRRDPKASVLVTNHLDEPERWVAFDGRVSISDTGGFELAERIAPRYWDLEDPAKRQMVEVWRSGRDGFCLLTLEPTKIRTGG